MTVQTNLKPSDDSDRHSKVQRHDHLVEVLSELLGQDGAEGGQDQSSHAEAVADQVV